MSELEIATFVALDHRRKALIAQLHALQSKVGDILRSVHDVDREQDAWMVTFAANHGVIESLGRLQFDIASGVVTVEE